MGALQQRNPMMHGAVIALWLLLAACLLRDSSAPLPADVMVKLQRWATPTPPNRLPPPHEHTQEKAP